MHIKTHGVDDLKMKEKKIVALINKQVNIISSFFLIVNEKKQ